MIVAVMYGMTPSAKIDSMQQRAAGEEVDQSEQAVGARVRREALLDVREVHERRRDVGAETVDRDDGEGETDLPTQVRGCGRSARWR